MLLLSDFSFLSVEFRHTAVISVTVDVSTESSVCVLSMTVNCAKTAEPIEMPFGRQTDSDRI